MKTRGRGGEERFFEDDAFGGEFLLLCSLVVVGCAAEGFCSGDDE